MRWFWQPTRRPDVHIRSAASTLAGVSIAGPRVARARAAPGARWTCRLRRFKFFQVAQTAVGFAPCVLTRAGFTGELGYEIWTTPDYFASLYDELWEAGREPGTGAFWRARPVLAAAGEGYGSFNKDFRPDYTPARPGSTASSTSTSRTSPAALRRSPSAPAVRSGASLSWKLRMRMRTWSATNRS